MLLLEKGIPIIMHKYFIIIFINPQIYVKE